MVGAHRAGNPATQIPGLFLMQGAIVAPAAARAVRPFLEPASGAAALALSSATPQANTKLLQAAWALALDRTGTLPSGVEPWRFPREALMTSSFSGSCLKHSFEPSPSAPDGGVVFVHPMGSALLARAEGGILEILPIALVPRGPFLIASRTAPTAHDNMALQREATRLCGLFDVLGDVAADPCARVDAEMRHPALRRCPCWRRCAPNTARPTTPATSDSRYCPSSKSR